MLLYLNLKGEYFDEIREGRKHEEYRLYNDYWMKRLLFREYTGIILRRGYPKSGDRSRMMERIWRGWTIKKIQHKHFGPKPVTVFAIRVNP